MKYYVKSGCVSSVQFSENHKEAAIDFLYHNLRKTNEIGRFIIVDTQQIQENNHDSQIFFSTESLLEDYQIKLIYS